MEKSQEKLFLLQEKLDLSEVKITNWVKWKYNLWYKPFISVAADYHIYGFHCFSCHILCVCFLAVSYVVSEWSMWSGCLELCKHIMRTRQRQVIQEARNWGEPYSSLHRTAWSLPTVNKPLRDVLKQSHWSSINTNVTFYNQQWIVSQYVWGQPLYT